MNLTDLSVVVPIYEEELNLPELHKRLTATLKGMDISYELWFVNDGSKDGSASVLRQLAAQDPNTYFLMFSRNFGHQIAVMAGLDNVRGKAVVIMDGDLQDPPELIPELYATYSEGYEVVYARRRSREGESWFKKATAKLFYRLLKKLTEVDIPLDTGDFRLIDQKVVAYLKEMPEQSKFLRGQIAWMGFRSAEVLFDRDSRMHGKSHYPLKKMLRFALDGITGFSDKPLLWVSRLGFSISAISGGLIAYALLTHFIWERTITGWTSLMITLTFLGGVQLLAIGVIGQYLSRMHRNLQGRPLYVVQLAHLPEAKESSSGN